MTNHQPTSTDQYLLSHLVSNLPLTAIPAPPVILKLLEGYPIALSFVLHLGRISVDPCPCCPPISIPSCLLTELAYFLNTFSVLDSGKQTIIVCLNRNSSLLS